MINLDVGKIVFTRFWIWDQETTIYERNNNNRKVNVFCMKNWGWKTLLFTAINYILSGKDDSFFGAKITDICIYLDVRISTDIFSFRRYHGGFEIVKNGESISVLDYQTYIEQKLWIDEELIDKKWEQTSQKNTPQSLFRFWFYSDNDLKLKNKWNLQSINLINSRFDWMGKKALFAYHLWVNLTANEYKKIKSYLYKKKYLEDNQKLINKNKDFYNNDGNLFFDPQESDRIYEQLSISKRKIGDITVALDKLDKIISDYRETKWEDEKYHFLISQKQVLELHKANILNNINIQKDKFKQYSMFEKKYLSEDHILEKDVKRIELYYSFSKDIEQLELWDIPTIIRSFVDPEVSKFKEFLDSKWNEYWIKSKYPWITLDTTSLSIIVNNGLSEWEAIFLRVISSLFLSIYWNQLEWSRCFSAVFYDSIVEKIDDDNINFLFDIIEEINHKENLPEIFMFSTTALSARDSDIINFNYESILD